MTNEELKLKIESLRIAEKQSFVYGDLIREAADIIENLSKDLEQENKYSPYWEEQAKDAKEKLQKYMYLLALTKASRQWISVNERLPDIGKSIIFATKYGDTAEGKYIGDCWVQYRWTTKVKNESVTHWMPLPEPPKEKT